MRRNPYKAGHRRAMSMVAMCTALSVAALIQIPVGAGAASRAAVSHLSYQRGASPFKQSKSNLVNHRGPVLASSDIYEIWWGSASAWPLGTQGGLTNFFGGLNGSSYVNIATQYDGALSVNASAPLVVDPSTPPPASQVSPSTLGSEVSKIYGSTIDPNGIYFVFTSNAPGRSYCAWHSYASVSGTTVSVAYMPNLQGVSGCSVSTGASDAQDLANVTAHEFMESITDPQLNAWYDNSGQEIGDKCAWTFNSGSGIVTLNNGSQWKLQEEWSNDLNGPNSIGGCTTG